MSEINTSQGEGIVRYFTRLFKKQKQPSILELKIQSIQQDVSDIEKKLTGTVDRLKSVLEPGTFLKIQEVMAQLSTEKARIKITGEGALKKYRRWGNTASYAAALFQKASCDESVAKALALLKRKKESDRINNDITLINKYLIQAYAGKKVPAQIQDAVNIHLNALSTLKESHPTNKEQLRTHHVEKALHLIDTHLN